VDAYNANPTSMMAAMDFFVKIPSSLPKAVIIGEMSELGNISLEEHQKLVNFIASQQFEKVYLVGNHLQNVDRWRRIAKAVDEWKLFFVRHRIV